MLTICGQNAGLLHKWAVLASIPTGRNEKFDISHPGTVVNHKSIALGTTGVTNRLIGGNDLPYPTKVAAAMWASCWLITKLDCSGMPHLEKGFVYFDCLHVSKRYTKEWKGLWFQEGSSRILIKERGHHRRVDWRKFNPMDAPTNPSWVCACHKSDTSWPHWDSRCRWAFWWGKDAAVKTRWSWRWLDIDISTRRRYTWGNAALWQRPDGTYVQRVYRTALNDGKQTRVCHS